jgi:hypothetical protein
MRTKFAQRQKDLIKKEEEIFVSFQECLVSLSIDGFSSGNNL